MGQIYHALGLTTGVVNEENSYLYDPTVIAEQVGEADALSEEKRLEKKEDEVGAFKIVYELLRHPEFAKELENTNEAVTPSIIDDEKTDGKGVIPQPEDKMKKPVEKMMKKK
jgi:hypothetical protein